MSVELNTPPRLCLAHSSPTRLDISSFLLRIQNISISMKTSRCLCTPLLQLLIHDNPASSMNILFGAIPLLLMQFSSAWMKETVWFFAVVLEPDLSLDINVLVRLIELYLPPRVCLALILFLGFNALIPLHLVSPYLSL